MDIIESNYFHAWAAGQEVLMPHSTLLYQRLINLNAWTNIDRSR